MHRAFGLSHKAIHYDYYDDVLAGGGNKSIDLTVWYRLILFIFMVQ